MDNAAELVALFAARAEELKIRMPEAGPWLSIDGLVVYHALSSFQEEQKPYPTAAEQLGERLKQMGTFVADFHPHRELFFVGPDGQMYVGRLTEMNQKAVIQAGFKEGECYGPRGIQARIHPDLRGEINRVFSTPESEEERLIFSIRDGNLEEFKTSLSRVKNPFFAYNGTCCSDCLLEAEHAHKREMLERLWAAGYPPIPSVRGWLNNIMGTGVDNREILSLLFEKGYVQPFLRIYPSSPSFVSISNLQAKNQSVQVLDTVLSNDAKLSEVDRKLLQTHRDLVSTLHDRGSYGGEGDDQSLYSKKSVANQLQLCWIVADELFGGQTQPIPSQLHDLMRPLISGTPEQSRKFRTNIGEFLQAKDSHIDYLRDPAREFATYVILPLALTDWSKRNNIPLTDKVLKRLDDDRNQLIKQMTVPVQQYLYGGRSLDKMTGLALAWHHPRNTFPDPLRPLQAHGGWHSFTEDKVIPAGDTGLKIHVLTSSNDLKSEGDYMHHCVGRSNYASRCLAGEIHILSVRDQQGNSLSTVEVKMTSSPPNLEILTNLGFDDNPPPGQTVTAMKCFKEEFDAGKIKLSGSVGETTESRKNRRRPAILEEIGYEITPENMAMVFDQFKHSGRRALEWSPETKNFDHQSRKVDFVPKTGTIEVIGELGQRTGKSVSPRDLPPEKWFEYESAFKGDVIKIIDHAMIEKPLWKRAQIAAQKQLQLVLSKITFENIMAACLEPSVNFLERRMMKRDERLRAEAIDRGENPPDYRDGHGPDI